MNPDPVEHIRVDLDLARYLVSSQFPAWADLPVRPVAASGHDNAAFRLGSEMLVKFPTAAGYADNLAAEAAAMVAIGTSLTVPIPQPVAAGEPSAAYPWPWRIQTWIPGEPASDDFRNANAEFADDLATFLRSLHAAPTSAGRPAGESNFHRGGDLREYGAQTEEAIAALAGTLDTARASKIWQDALASDWDSAPVWVHGDVAPGNLICDSGRLVGVIDFGQCAVGDPACDLVIAWTFLGDEARSTFRDSMGIDAQTWRRARGWALWKALIVTWWAGSSDPYSVAHSPRILTEVMSDPIAT